MSGSGDLFLHQARAGPMGKAADQASRQPDRPSVRRSLAAAGRVLSGEPADQALAGKRVEKSNINNLLR